MRLKCFRRYNSEQTTPIKLIPFIIILIVKEPVTFKVTPIKHITKQHIAVINPSISIFV